MVKLPDKPMPLDIFHAAISLQAGSLASGKPITAHEAVDWALLTYEEVKNRLGDDEKFAEKFSL